MDPRERRSPADLHRRGFVAEAPALERLVVHGNVTTDASSAAATWIYAVGDVRARSLKCVVAAGFEGQARDASGNRVVQRCECFVGVAAMLDARLRFEVEYERWPERCTSLATWDAAWQEAERHRVPRVEPRI